MNTILSNSSHLTEYRFGFGLSKCKCDFCEVLVEEDELFSIGGYTLCADCKAEYLVQQENGEAQLNITEYLGYKL